MQPQTATPQPTTDSKPIALHTLVGVLVAGLLGGPLATALIIARNFRQLTRPAGGILFLGILAEIALAAGLWFIPGWGLRIGLIVLQGIIGYVLCGIIMGPVLSAADRKGILDDAENLPIWRTALFGLVIGAFLFAGLWTARHYLGHVSSQPGLFRHAVSIHEDLLYTDASMAAQATNVGQALLDSGYFTNRGNNIALLARDDQGRWVVTLVMPEEAWNRPRLTDDMQRIGAQAAIALHEHVITIRVVDDNWIERARIDTK